PHLARARDRHAGHDDVDLVLAEAADEVVPLHRPELERPTERPRQLLGEVDLETDEPAFLAEGERRRVGRDPDPEGRSRGGLRSGSAGGAPRGASRQCGDRDTEGEGDAEPACEHGVGSIARRARARHAATGGRNRGPYAGASSLGAICAVRKVRPSMFGKEPAQHVRGLVVLDHEGGPVGTWHHGADSPPGAGRQTPVCVAFYPTTSASYRRRSLP